MSNTTLKDKGCCEECNPVISGAMGWQMGRCNNPSCKCHSQPTGEKKCIHPLSTRPLLYSDTIGGKQVLRDDMWAVTTKELNDLVSPPPVSDWRAQFDEKFVGGFDSLKEDSPYVPKIKSFIADLLARTEKEAYERGTKEITARGELANKIAERNFKAGAESAKARITAGLEGIKWKYYPDTQAADMACEVKTGAIRHVGEGAKDAVVERNRVLDAALEVVAETETK